MLKIISAFSILISLASTAFAQSNTTESLTITTYYPSPYGVYRNLRLSPTNNVPNTPPLAGIMFFNNNTGYKMIQYHNGTGWVNLTTPAAPAPSYWVASGTNIYNNNTGNVGIGTTTPQYKLHVNGRIQGTQVCDGSKCLNQCLTSYPVCPGTQVCKPSNYIDPSTCPSGQVVQLAQFALRLDARLDNLANLIIMSRLALPENLVKEIAPLPDVPAANLAWRHAHRPRFARFVPLAPVARLVAPHLLGRHMLPLLLIGQHAAQFPKFAVLPVLSMVGLHLVLLVRIQRGQEHIKPEQTRHGISRIL